jgi:hypothetical protein
MAHGKTYYVAQEEISMTSLAIESQFCIRPAAHRGTACAVLLAAALLLDPGPASAYCSSEMRALIDLGERLNRMDRELRTLIDRWGNRGGPAAPVCGQAQRIHALTQDYERRSRALLTSGCIDNSSSGIAYQRELRGNVASSAARIDFYRKIITLACR